MARNEVNRSRSPRLIPILLVLLIAPLAVLSGPAPSPRRLPAFAKINDKLYIQGGFNQTTYTGQLLSLDLSLNWPSSAPAWDLTLPDGIATSRHGMAAIAPKFSAGLGTSTQGYLLLAGSSNNITAAFWNAYDIQQKKWSPVTVTPKAPLTAANTYPHLQGQSVVTDPGTGLVYVVGGFWNTTYNRLMIMDPSTSTLLHFETANSTASLSSESAVWSTAKNTILVFGGSLAPPNVATGFSLATVQEYNPATSAWTSLVGRIVLFALLSPFLPSPSLVLSKTYAKKDTGEQECALGGNRAALSPIVDVCALFPPKSNRQPQATCPWVAWTSA